VVNSTGNSLPEPIVLSTSQISTSGGSNVEKEKYECMLVKYENVTVTDDNADGDSRTRW